MIELTLYLSYSPTLNLLIENHRPLLSGLFETLFCLLLRQPLQNIRLLLEHCTLGLYLHVFEPLIDLALQGADRRRGEEIDCCRIVSLYFREVQRLFLSVQLYYPDPLISLLLSGAITGLSLDGELLL